MIQGPESDGLNMVYLHGFIKSMKISWIERLYKSSHEWLIAEQSIPSLEGIQTYGSGKLQYIKRHMHNPFWKDAIDAWAEFIKLYKPNAEQLVTEKLWFTDVSKYRNSIIKNWDVKGIRFVADLINNTTGTFYSKNEIESKYDVKMTFLCYDSLISSLPNIMKTTNFISKIVYPVIPYKISLLHGKTKISRLAHREFQLSMKPNHRKSQTKLENKWIRDINCFNLGTVVAKPTQRGVVLTGPCVQIRFWQETKKNDKCRNKMHNNSGSSIAQARNKQFNLSSAQ